MSPIKPLIEQSISYLDSPAAREAIKLDPYWPKWDSPWWHMTLLWEMGLAPSIPRSIVEDMLKALRTHYLGVMHQVLSACGVPVDAELPWIKPWFLRYQLPDGGLNCEAEAYTSSRKSSVVSTVPVLEAMLRSATPRTPEQDAFLDRGARYLIAHRLVRSSSGVLIEPDWLKPCFPRFYDYDVLRDARLLLEWSRQRGQPLPPTALSDAKPWLNGTPIIIERSVLERRSLVWNGRAWSMGIASSFPLLEAVSYVGEPSPLKFDSKLGAIH